MPRFTGQNKKRIDPRYFINETMDPRIAAMMTLKPGAQVNLQTGEVAEIVDVIDPGQTFEVAIDGGDEEKTITIYDIDMDQLRAPGDLREGMFSQMMGDAFVEEGDELMIDGYEVEVTDVIEPGQTIQVAFLDTKDGLDQATAVWNGSEFELARS